MSDLDRVSGLKHLLVRAMVQVIFAATLKATGLIIRRAAAFRSRRATKKSGYFPNIELPPVFSSV